MSKIDFYGASWCGDCVRSKRVLDTLNIEYIYHDVESDDAARAKATEISGKMSIPVIQFEDGSFFVEPSDPELREKLQSLGLTD
jgi:glutaredoxin-like protein